MRLPISLIKSFVPLNETIETIADTLTLLGLEIDSILNKHPAFAGVIVGEVLSVKPHPDAEKLQIAQVHDGKKAVQVVCGAPNCRPGIKTAFARVGALMVDGNGEQRTIEKASIRGIESHGMLCSASELHLWKDNSGILELPLSFENGKDLTLLLWDPVLEISLTPNLGHCLSALGIARELSAAFQTPISKKDFSLNESKASSTEEKIQVRIEDSELCPLYMGRLIENVKIGPSPFWIQKELFACGLKPICNVVDVTNYIMLKRGQPLHAFDWDLLEGKSLHIGASRQSEKWIGLDGIEREIPEKTLVIRDSKKTVAIAGIMGGLNSAVTSETRNVFLEAAFFDPMTVRKGAKKVSLRTDSAIRFEKGIDPNGVKDALEEAAHWISILSEGSVAKGRIHLQAQEFPLKKIRIRPERVNQLLGTKISQTEMESIFQRLECKILESDAKSILVEVPSYRFDISEEIDLIEEVVRIFGYNNIEKRPELTRTTEIPNDPAYLFEKKIRQTCVSLGLQEFLTSDLIGPKQSELCLEFMSVRGIQFLKAIHAKTEEYSILRPSLLPGLLHVAKNNFDLKNAYFSAFEIGRIHFLQDQKCVEAPMLSILLTGKEAPAHWSRKNEEVDFYTLKGILENLFTSCRISPFSFHLSKHVSLHPGRQADIRCGELTIGSLGEIHPQMLSKADIKQRLLFAELNLESLMALQKETSRFTAIPNLPSSERDWTVPIPLNALMEPLFEAIVKHKPSILEKFELIDLYQPENASHKNATFRFTYRDPIKTISAEEVELQHTKLISQLALY